MGRPASIASKRRKAGFAALTHVICVSGHIGSGKTTLCWSLAETLSGCHVRSFGDVVRARAQAQGLPSTRLSLQEVGSAMIREGWHAFVSQLLVDLPGGFDVLIVDGIRHIGALSGIRDVMRDTQVVLVFLSCDANTLEGRLVQRGEALRVPRHAVEEEISGLAIIADIVLDATEPLEVIVETLVTYLGLTIQNAASEHEQRLIFDERC
ncbi:AAA family ATPase [Acidithrix ferrooxidans]|uniref:AAA family ATPase n=1 Tax=Acidithrix ferrooxidans TaxID=1280514 RepID=UPI0009E1C8BF|nr:AAA family ATPase [Acidithrix ferrooxidans]